MAETRQSITINSSSAVSGDGGNHDDDNDGDDAIFQDQYMFFSGESENEEGDNGENDYW